FNGPAHPAEDVDLPRRIKADLVQVALLAGGAELAAERVLAVAPIRRGSHRIHRRELVRRRHAAKGSRLANPSRRLAKVETADQRAVDERLERRVIEPAPPLAQIRLLGGEAAFERLRPC